MSKIAINANQDSPETKPVENRASRRYASRRDYNDELSTAQSQQFSKNSFFDSCSRPQVSDFG
ncbi:hypothetical protein M514_09874 [Trichuris suis]|uniref:Uncharacterized protein n=1 Tax=Trichuris suis TaxID=68888 RepID=A0A085LW77_9BILA|nr:hypothetical protein M513_09874 [Trichuris suis]KFD65587.1 hypothetical protein M514_09874 [Trichuris suis]